MCEVLDRIHPAIDVACETQMTYVYPGQQRHARIIRTQKATEADANVTFQGAGKVPNARW